MIYYTVQNGRVCAYTDSIDIAKANYWEYSCESFETDERLEKAQNDEWYLKRCVPAEEVTEA
jgi:hypothetical protein